MKTVSVIIPAYNAENFISKAIESVLSQTFQDFEILVIDDGSTDQTKEVVAQYVCQFSEKVQYYYQTNKGPAAARNFGIAKAGGDFVSFLDSDDVWFDHKLEEQIRFFDAHPHYVMLYTDMKYYENGSLKFGSFLKERPYRLAASGKIYNKLIEEGIGLCNERTIPIINKPIKRVIIKSKPQRMMLSCKEKE